MPLQHIVSLKRELNTIQKKHFKKFKLEQLNILRLQDKCILMKMSCKVVYLHNLTQVEYDRNVMISFFKKKEEIMLTLQIMNTYKSIKNNSRIPNRPFSSHSVPKQYLESIQITTCYPFQYKKKPLPVHLGLRMKKKFMCLFSRGNLNVVHHFLFTKQVNKSIN